MMKLVLKQFHSYFVNTFLVTSFSFVTPENLSQVVLSTSHATRLMATSAAAKFVWSGPLFGRLPRSGREYLVEKGWDDLGGGPGDPTELLQFIWPNKSGPQFETSSLYPSLIRPYPVEVTNVLDDKVLLSRLIQGSIIDPGCIQTPEDANENQLYFVKHRYGAQGKSVYAYNKSQLQEWWIRQQNTKDFSIQKEVIPALDNGRKFVMRSHLLVIKKNASPFEAFVHEDVVCSTHASAYNSNAKSAHVSQAGKRFPKPELLQNLPSSHPASNVFEKIFDSSQILMQLAESSGTFSDPLPDGAICFALFGNDFLVSNQLDVKLCEVNSHPALGWGTMKDVSPKVFKRLIEDMLDIVVFGESEKSIRFRKLTIQVNKEND